MTQSQTLLRAEVANILRGLAFTAYALPDTSPQWLDGYMAAVEAMATSIGITPPAPERRTWNTNGVGPDGVTPFKRLCDGQGCGEWVPQ